MDRLKNCIATTPPGLRWPCKKRVVLLKAGQHWAHAMPSPPHIRKEKELRKLAEEDRVLKRQRLDIEERFEWAKVGAQGFQAS